MTDSTSLVGAYRKLHWIVRSVSLSTGWLGECLLIGSSIENGLASILGQVLNSIIIIWYSESECFGWLSPNKFQHPSFYLSVYIVSSWIYFMTKNRRKKTLNNINVVHLALWSQFILFYSFFSSRRLFVWKLAIRGMVFVAIVFLFI